MDNLPTLSEAENAVLDKMSPTARDALTMEVQENLREILRGMIESAKGMWVERTVQNKHGVVMTVPAYQEKPNMDVAQYLINQLMGKPKETSVDLHLKQNIIVQNEITVKKMA